MRVKVGFTSEHPWDASLDWKGVWESGEVSNQEEAMTAFREDHPSANVDFVDPVQ